MSTLCAQPDGTVRGIYTERIDLGTLGPLHVERATWIEFDNRVQAWRVLDAFGDCLYCAPTRHECLEWEHKHLNWVLESE